jgi:hypothetical protein
LRLFLDDLAWIDGRETPRGPAQDALAAMGAFSPSGVTGAFTHMFGGIPADHLSAVGMVYADLAWAWGYLEPASTLTAGEYARLRRDAREWAAAADRSPADVVAEFGEPSLGLPGYNPRFPVSFGYLPPDRSQPLVVFDFWQDAGWGQRVTYQGSGPSRCSATSAGKPVASPQASPTPRSAAPSQSTTRMNPRQPHHHDHDSSPRQRDLVKPQTVNNAGPRAAR